MRRLLGPLIVLPLLTVLLGACGGNDDTVPDPGGTGAGTQSTSPTTPRRLDYDATLLHETGGGGRVSDSLTQIDTTEDLTSFVRQFSLPAFAKRVRNEIEAARGGSGELYAATVSIGCDLPPGVEVTKVGGGYAVTVRDVPNPLPECFAPVSTVAVVTITR